jgi:hypothetical protein
MAASDVSLAAGCAVIKALSPNGCIDGHLSGNTLRRRILPRYWTVVQHRARVWAVPPVALIVQRRCEHDPGLSSGPMLRR